MTHHGSDLRLSFNLFQADVKTLVTWTSKLGFDGKPTQLFEKSNVVKVFSETHTFYFNSTYKLKFYLQFIWNQFLPKTVLSFLGDKWKFYDGFGCGHDCDSDHPHQGAEGFCAIHSSVSTLSTAIQ